MIHPHPPHAGTGSQELSQPRSLSEPLKRIRGAEQPARGGQPRLRRPRLLGDALTIPRVRLLLSPHMLWRFYCQEQAVKPRVATERLAAVCTHMTLPGSSHLSLPTAEQLLQQTEIYLKFSNHLLPHTFARRDGQRDVSSAQVETGACPGKGLRHQR